MSKIMIQMGDKKFLFDAEYPRDINPFDIETRFMLARNSIVLISSQNGDYFVDKKSKCILRVTAV